MPANRAVSSAVTYTTLIAVTFVLTTGLVVGGDALVQDQRQETVRTQLAVTGERLADTLMTADRLARGTEGEPESLALTNRLPERVGGSGYRIAIESGPDQDTLVLEANDVDANVVIHFDVESELEDTRVVGGQLRIVYNTGPTPSQLEVHHG